MKKEQLVDMIGEAPENYVQDAGKRGKKRRVSRRWKWVGGIAAALAVVLLVNHMPAIPSIVSAKAVSAASESRKTERPKSGSDAERFDAWLAEWNAREALVETAQTPVAAFSEALSREVLSASDASASDASASDTSASDASADETNRAWSPVNAYIALAMTAELTDGEARTQILNVLGANDLAELRERIGALWEDVYEDDGKEISTLANSLWLDDDLEYAQETMDSIAYYYYASVYQGELGSEKIDRAITNWMRNQTGGALKDRVGKADLAKEDMALTIASTIYFQSKWGDEFDAGMNTNDVFHAASGDVEATFMNKREYETYYYWGENYAAVRVYLKNGSNMWFFLPDEGYTVDDVLSDGEYMETIVRTFSEDDGETVNHKWMKVNLSVPKFDVSSSVNVKEGLQNLGVSAIFDWTTNSFASSLKNENSEYPVYLDGINQDSRVKIDEKGVVAASYIELNFGAGAPEPPDEIIDFTLDRPFLFVVEKNRIPLFVGTVRTP